MGPLLFRAAARHDINEASYWYEQRRTGLGEEFLGELDRTFERIQISPEMYDLVLRTVRRARVRRFPYYVYFSSSDAGTMVYAVMHAKRNPRRWKSRLQ